MKLSLVVPCYNEEDNIRLFYEAVKQAFEGHIKQYEFVFVNDGSKDATLGELKKLFQRETGAHIKIISFSRNFGKEAAILAGIKNAVGEYTTLIDGDLQQPPKVVLEMVKRLEQEPELDCVAAYQEARKEGKILSFYKRCFYKLINKISDVNFVPGASDFRTFRRSVVEAVLDMPEYFRFSKGIFSWVGFETAYIPYEVDARASGESKWSFIKLFRYAVEGIVSFTTVPLKFATFLGAGTSLIATIYLAVVIIQKMAFLVDIPGYTTIVGLLLLFGGIQLLVLGIIGEYLARIYVQGKNRPVFIIKELLSYEQKEGLKDDMDS